MEPATALRVLHEAIKDCTDCVLHRGRTQVVFGVGAPTADLMFVGEGPGFHEDRQGEPFVGQAGKLLTELLAGIGLSRSDVYIANVVKCRPPDNRDPAPDEIEACSPKLLKQIEIIQPRVICTLGRFATRLLADTELSITSIHGKAKERDLGGRRVIVFPVFHPAAALYTPANRRVLEEDFAKLRLLVERGAEALRGTEERGAAERGAGPRVGAEERGAEMPATAEGARGELAGHEESVRTAPAEQLPLW